MNYFVKIYSNKPKEDINQIVESMGYIDLAPKWSRSGGIYHFLVKLYVLINILFRIKKNDTLLIQYPLKKFYTLYCIFVHLKGGNIVTLIHDLGCFRRKKLTVNEECKMLNRSDYLIVHNPSMDSFLKSNGCKTKSESLKIFDYISPSVTHQYATPHSPWKVIYAGGLSYKRNPFLYNLESAIDSWSLELFGKDFDKNRCTESKHIHYHGLLKPDYLLMQAEGDFGLVWDGNSLDECSGEWGEYLKINNPHKTSFYLRAGIPIIIWKYAALSPFIEEQKIGITVNSLRDIDKTLLNLSKDDYNKIRENAMNISKKISSGYYTRTALTEANSFFNNANNK